jgi:uncharacterized protein with HEPN domain
VTEPDIAYLNHILDAITHIKNFSSGISSADELRDHPLQRAGIERMLTVIGEAAKNVSSATKQQQKNAILMFHGKRLRGCGTS